MYSVQASCALDSLLLTYSTIGNSKLSSVNWVPNFKLPSLEWRAMVKYWTELRNWGNGS